MAELVTLSGNLHDLLEGDVANLHITASIPPNSMERAEAEAGPPAVPARLIIPDPVETWSAADGTFSLQMIPTDHLESRTPYTLTIERWGSVQLIITADISITAYLAAPASPIPARQLPDPAATPDGDIPISVSNQWQAGRIIIVQTAAPARPASGVAAIWIDTSATPPLWQYWDGTGWQAFTVQDGHIVNSHLAPDSIDPDNLDADQPTQKQAFRTRLRAAADDHDHGTGGTPLADDSITPAMAQADSPAQKQGWRTRINAEEAGHDHGTGGTPLADDSITPAMAQADQPAQKQAWRTRLDTAADIADWAEEGNTDDVPAAKMPPITPAMAQADNPTEQTAWRTRLNAEEAGHDHGTGGGGAIADDSITPAMAQADSPAQKTAWRNRLDVKADIADWAEDGNTDDVPAGKLPAIDTANLASGVENRLLPTGGSTGQVPKRTATGVAWADEAVGEDAATWAEEGNTDLIPAAKLPDIPRSKLPASAHTPYIKEHSMTITVDTLGPANEGRGFDRMTIGGGGSATDASFTLDGETLQVIAVEQIVSGQFSIRIVGTLPANFRDRYWIIEDSAGLVDVLRMQDATRYVAEPRDTSYPAGLQTYREIDWNAQATNLLYTRSIGSTFTLSLAVSPEERLEDFVAPWAQTGNTDDLPDDKIGDDAITPPRLDADTDTKKEALRVRLGLPAQPSPSLRAIQFLRGDYTWAEPAAPMGGAGGQSAADSLAQIVSVWKWAGTTPPTTELTGANAPTWGRGGWSNLPTGWAAPAPTTGNGNLYRATTVATWNETTSSFDLGSWSIIAETSLNTQYSPDPNAVPLVTSATRTAASRFWRTRDPVTGHWANLWNALYTGLATWTVLASVPFNDITTKTQVKTVTFSQAVRTRDFRLFAVNLDLRNPALNQVDLTDTDMVGVWNNVWPVANTDTSNNYASGASFVVTAGHGDGVDMVSGQGTLPTNINAGASNYFGCKFKLRGNTASGLLQSVRFHEWAAVNQRGYVTLLYL